MDRDEVLGWLREHGTEKEDQDHDTLHPVGSLQRPDQVRLAREVG